MNDELRKANALAGRSLAQTQAYIHLVFQLREAISQAHGELHRGNSVTAKQLLQEAMELDLPR